MKFDAPVENRWTIQTYHFTLHECGGPQVGEVTRLAQKGNTYVVKLCTFPNRLVAEITRNRNGHTRSVNVHISEYLAWQIDHISNYSL